MWYRSCKRRKKHNFLRISLLLVTWDKRDWETLWLKTNGRFIWYFCFILFFIFDLGLWRPNQSSSTWMDDDNKGESKHIYFSVLLELGVWVGMYVSDRYYSIFLHWIILTSQSPPYVLYCFDINGFMGHPWTYCTMFH